MAALAGTIAGTLWLIPAVAAQVSGRYLGNGTADVWGHAAGYAWVAAALARGRSPSSPPIDFPAGQAWSVVDLPVAAALAPVTAVLGPSGAWNLGIPLGIGVGAAGAAAWASRRTDPASAVVAGLLWAVAPFVRGVVASGVPEALVLGLVPWMLLAMDERPRLAWLPALLLAWIGPYSALDAAIVVAAWSAWHRRVPVAALAGLGAGGALLAASAWGHPSFAAETDGPVNPGAMWAWASRGGADLANWVVPSLLLPSPEPTVLHRHVAWLGFATGIAAVVLAIRRPELRWLLVAAAVALALTLGPSLRIGGVRTPVPMPGALLGPLVGQNPWRHAGLVALILPMVFATDRRWLAVLLVEGLLAPAPLVPPTVADPVGPIERILAGGEGGVLDLPLDREGRLPKGPQPQRAFVLGAAHGRPIASALYVVPSATRHPAVLALDDAYQRALAADPGWRRPRAPDLPPAPSSGSFPAFVIPGGPASRAELIADGFRDVTLAVDAVPPSARPAFERALTDWLGPPERKTPNRWWWRLSEIEDPPSRDRPDEGEQHHR